VIISERLRSDWKMVPSDGRLNITAGGLGRFKNGSSTSEIGSKGAATIDQQRPATHRRRLIGPAMAS
jgi:hypothetical protein